MNRFNVVKKFFWRAYGNVKYLIRAMEISQCPICGWRHGEDIDKALSRSYLGGRWGTYIYRQIWFDKWKCPRCGEIFEYPHLKKA